MAVSSVKFDGYSNPRDHSSACSPVVCSNSRSSNATKHIQNARIACDEVFSVRVIHCDCAGPASIKDLRHRLTRLHCPASAMTHMHQRSTEALSRKVVSSVCQVPKVRNHTYGDSLFKDQSHASRPQIPPRQRMLPDMALLQASNPLKSSWNQPFHPR